MGSRASLWAVLLFLVAAGAVLGRHGDVELILLFSLLEIVCAYILGRLSAPGS